MLTALTFSPYSPARNLLLRAAAALALFAGLAGIGLAQTAVDGPPGLDLGLGQQLGGQGGAKDRVSVTAKVVGGPGGGTLHVTATIKEGYHIYSVTQKSGGPEATVLAVASGKGYKTVGEFVARNKPDVHEEPEIWPGIPIEEHHGTVTWIAPITYDSGVNPESTPVEGTVKGQVCDANSCLPFTIPFSAAYEKPTETPGEITIGHATIRGSLGVAAAAPGEKVPLRLTIEPAEGWHAYKYSPRPVDEDEFTNKATLVVVYPPNGFSVGATSPGSPEVATNDLAFYDGPVTFTTMIEAPRDAKVGDTAPISGIIGFQVCKSDGSCDLPTAARFTVSLPIRSESAEGTTPATFERAKHGYGEAADEANKAAVPLDLLAAIGASVLGGLILNLMPCVLPVIGLKIMAFVEQAHHDRKKVLTLNLWYCLGLIAVFMALATLSVLLNKSWGTQFQSTWFNVALSALVFAMALSFLGVWEIPIPGFVGSGRAGDLAQQEGAAGAFSKGVLTTVLATPCSGPFLGAVFGLTLNQPAHIVYTIFASIGLGMASPYLVIGAVPELIRFLPKPGAWMETFKQAMGFVLLGTVVFLFTFIDKNYLVPTFALLMAIWAGCWWIGRVPLTAELGKKSLGWAVGMALAFGLGGGAFAALKPAEPILPWKKFSVADVDAAKKAGKTVMIDFTADWCLTCKTNLKLAVDTKRTLEFVEKYDVVPFLADWTKPDEEIKKTLNELGSNSIPVLAIYPAGQPDQPIILRDLLSQQDVIDALEKAGASRREVSSASDGSAPSNVPSDVPATSTAGN